MKHFYKIIFGLGILLLGTGLSSCSIAVKAVYNQFSDKDEFVLFRGERRTQAADRKKDIGEMEDRNKVWSTVPGTLGVPDNFDTETTVVINKRNKGIEEEKEWKRDLANGFVADSL